LKDEEMEVSMKKRIYTALVITVLLSVIGVSSARAQSTGHQQLTASIPFAFSVGQTTLPAGEYIVSLVNPTSDQRVLLIRSKDGRSSVFQQTIGVSKKSNTAKLVFNRCADRYFFAQAWMPTDDTGFAVLKSGAERAMERDLAKASKKSELVSVSVR